MRRVFTAALIVAVGWWLFRDTYIRHSPGQSDPNVIRFSHFGPHESYLFWRDVIALFEKAHPDLRVKHEYVVGLGNHYNIKMRQQVIAGALPDVSLIQLGPFRDLADHFADLSVRPRSDDVDRGTSRPGWRCGVVELCRDCRR